MTSFVQFAKRGAVSAGVALLLLAILMLVAAAVCLSLDIARKTLPVVAIPLAGVAALVAGYLQVRPVRKQGLLLGLLAASALYVVLLVLALIVSRAHVGVNAVFLLMAMLAGGAAGGVLAANRAAPARKHGGKGGFSRRR